MKGCPHWHHAVADCALGNSPEPALATHLAVCPHCENALRESRAAAARIDGALARRAAVEPPVYGPERVMARVIGRAATRSWRWAAVACAVAAMSMAVVMWMRHRTPAADVTALSTWRSPTQALLRPPVAAAWITTPRWGEGFFKVMPMGEIHAK